MKKAAILMLCAAGLWGCFSASPNKAYFQLYLEPKAAPAPAFDKILLIDRLVVDNLYDDFRILYRLTPYEVNYYPYIFWADKPSQMIRYALDGYLVSRKTFRRVLLDATRGETDWILRVVLHRIEEVDAAAAWRARLSMDLEIVEAKTERVLASRRFDRSEPLPRREVSALPPALSHILAEELEALLADLQGK
ncbi:MAG: ABC-type transport auxiliary lipoprotein family protein [Acidobacteriota bacterium]|nr:ABC-type transport auxiliary lipoprotein family protein [Acidobacteriota bacterium]